MPSLDRFPAALLIATCLAVALTLTVSNRREPVALRRRAAVELLPHTSSLQLPTYPLSRPLLPPPLPPPPPPPSFFVTFTQLGKYGRLGNQLFQVAAVIATAKRHGAQAQLPVGVRNLQLSQLFSLEGLDIATGPPPDPVSTYASPVATVFQLPPTLQPGTTDMVGFFQHAQYVHEAQPELQRALQLAPHLVRKVARELQNNTVAIHVGCWRRGGRHERSRLPTAAVCCCQPTAANTLPPPHARLDRSAAVTTCSGRMRRPTRFSRAPISRGR